MTLRECLCPMADPQTRVDNLRVVEQLEMRGIYTVEQLEAADQMTLEEAFCQALGIDLTTGEP